MPLNPRIFPPTVVEPMTWGAIKALVTTMVHALSRFCLEMKESPPIKSRDEREREGPPPDLMRRSFLCRCRIWARGWRAGVLELRLSAAAPPHRSIYFGEGWAEGGGEELQQGGGGRGSGREVAGEELSPTWGLTPPLPPTSPSSRRRPRERERQLWLGRERGWSSSWYLDQWESSILKLWIDDMASVLF